PPRRAVCRLVSPEEVYAPAPAVDRIGFPDAQARQALLFRDAAGKLVLVHADPFDGAGLDWVQELAGEPFEERVAHRSEVAAWLARHEEGLRAMDAVVTRGSGSGQRLQDAEDLSLRRIHEDSSPVVKLVNSTLYDALKLQASDVHLEATGAGLVVRYRLDGVLAPVARLDGVDQAEQVISR